MNRITVPFEVKQIDQGDDNFTFEGHLAVFNNVDLGFDKILPGAFKDFLKEARAEGRESIPVFWVHKDSEPVGIFPLSDMKEDRKGLKVKGLLPRADTFVSGRVVPQMKIGSVAQMSIGYSARDWKFEDDIRVLEKIHLWEGSLVPIAMNPEATITSMKSIVPFGDLPLAATNTKWNHEKALERVKEWAGIDNDLSDPSAREKYKKAFFWCDSDNDEEFESYKLPFADVIDGKLMAVPKGIFSAAAGLHGKRGGVTLPSNNEKGVKSNIQKYYGKMNMASPFEKVFRIDDLSGMDIRLLESLFKQGVCFTSTMAKAMVSAIKSAGIRDEEPAGLRDEGKEAIITKIDNILNNIKTGGK